MCSTHNPKRHYFATRQKICVRFTFVNEDSLSRSFMIDVAQFEEVGSLAVAKAVLYLETKGFNVEKYSIFLPQFDQMEIKLDQNPLIPFQKLPKKEMFFHLKRKNNQQTSSQEDHKKTKQPQRVIGEVIQKVKRWRGLFQNQKISLTQGAKKVDVPKKSLDDYYLLLRQAEILGYEFQKNLTSKMGELRAFLKKNAKKLPSGKLPQQMSKLKCYSLVAEYECPASKTVLQKQNENVFNFKEIQAKLKMHPMDLDDNCDYACNMSESDSD